MPCIPTFDCFDDITDTKNIFPVFKTFILFSIDHVATLKDAGINDPVVLKAAKQRKPKRYLGFVDADWFGAKYTECDITLISHGFPEPNEAEHIEPDMCIAISPSQNHLHPTGRGSFKPSRPLPFDNCFIHSHIPRVGVKLKRKFRRFDKATVLSGGQILLGRFLMSEDEERRKKLIHPKPSCDTDVDEGKKQTSNGKNGVNQMDQIGLDSWDGSQPECEDANEMEEDTEEKIDVEKYFAGPSDGQHHDRVVISNVSYDLTEVKDFDDPHDLFKERELLEGLIRDAKAREDEEGVDPVERTPQKGLNAKKRIMSILSRLHARST